jgi:ribose 5-phosphate isomerase A
LEHHALVPVETIPFALTPVRQRLEALGAYGELRQKNGVPFIIESHSFILDSIFPAGVSYAPYLNTQLCNVVIVVETGLFLNMFNKL